MADQTVKQSLRKSLVVLREQLPGALRDTYSRANVHYQRVVVALNETIRIMTEIDRVIETHGGWPGAFQALADEVAK